MAVPDEQKRMASALYSFAEQLRRAPNLARDGGASPEIQQRAMTRCVEITNSVLEACS